MLDAEHKMKLLFPHRPWETEPNHAEWTEELNGTGMRCRIRRNPITATLCGYVGVPKGHMFWGLSGDTDLDSVNAENCWQELHENTHGGLTYAQEGDDGYWYFGFDTAHLGDFAPGLVMSLLNADPKHKLSDMFGSQTYKTWEFVDTEIHDLMQRIAELTEQVLQQQGDDYDNDYSRGDRFELGD